MPRIIKALKYIIHPSEFIKKQRVALLIKKGVSLNDEEYLAKMFKIRVGYSLNLDNPKSFEEKLQWLKLYNRNPLYTTLSDKYLVRDFVAETIGDKYLVPLIGVYDNPDEIDFNSLPDQFVLKCNHNSGLGMYICKNKAKLTSADVGKIKQNLHKGLKQDYYQLWREWPYRDIKRKIVCEKYLGDGDGTGLIDYKFFCFSGEPKCLLICTNRAIDVRFDYFDIKLNRLPFEQGGKRAFYDPPRIENYDTMLDLVKRLCKNIPHVRVDLYNINGNIYFGEMTFFDSSGFAVFKPKKWDYIFGDWLELPKKR